jgi:hypothetical protein
MSNNVIYIIAVMYKRVHTNSVAVRKRGIIFYVTIDKENILKCINVVMLCLHMITTVSLICSQFIKV